MAQSHGFIPVSLIIFARVPWLPIFKKTSMPSDLHGSKAFLPATRLSGGSVADQNFMYGMLRRQSSLPG